MAHNPTLSILTTVYNRSRYLPECIESVQESKFQDYEHIIIDDGSSDDSVAIAQKYASNDPRIRVHINRQNLGDYPNRNEAATKAKGTYIKYLDADDTHGAWTTAILTDAMKKNPEAAIGIIEFQSIYPLRPTLLNPKEAYEAYYSKTRYFFDASPINVIMKRAAFLDAGGFSGKRMVGDFEMWHKMAALHGVVMIPHNLNFYRQHDDQEMSLHASDPIWGFRYVIIGMERLLDPMNPMDKRSTVHHLSSLERKAARTILSTIGRHGLKKAEELRNEVNWTWRQVASRCFA